MLEIYDIRFHLVNVKRNEECINMVDVSRISGVQKLICNRIEVD